MSGWAAGSAIVSLIGASYGAYSQYEAGQNAAAAQRYNAAQQQAANQAMLVQSAAKSLAQREENQRILAQQEAAFAAAGVVTNSGSPLSVETKQAALLERRALNTDYEGAIGYRYGAGKVVQDQMEGAAAKQAGDLGAAATLLSGVGNAANSYYKSGSGLGPSKKTGT